MKGIYLTKKGFKNIKKIILDLEENLEISEANRDTIRAGIETFEKKAYENILSSAKVLEKKVIKERLDVLQSFYYGEDLEDTEVIDFYKKMLEDWKLELENKLKEFKN
jgi:hypothetical protein